MLVELVLKGPDDDGDFEVRSCPQGAFLVFWDLISIYLSRDAGTGVHDGGHCPPCPLKWGANVPLHNSIIGNFKDVGER